MVKSFLTLFVVVGHVSATPITGASGKRSAWGRVALSPYFSW